MDNMLIGVHIQSKKGIIYRIVDKVLTASSNPLNPHASIHKYVLVTGTAGNLVIKLIEPLELNDYIIKGL